METVKADESIEAVFVPPTWVGLSSVERARQYNAQWIGWLCLRGIEGGASVTAPFLARNSDLWGRIDVEAQARAADFPFLIVDLRRIEATGAASLAQGEGCEDLLLDTLLTARQFAEADRTTAQMMFGVDAATAASFASLSVPQARKLARAGQPRFRWQDDAQFWRDWLLACWKADLQAIELLRHRAIRRICADLSEA